MNRMTTQLTSDEVSALHRKACMPQCLAVHGRNDTHKQFVHITEPYAQQWPGGNVCLSMKRVPHYFFITSGWRILIISEMHIIVNRVNSHLIPFICLSLQAWTLNNGLVV